MKNFSTYTFSVLSLAALSIGSLKEVVKIYLSEQHLEGWVLVVPMLSTSLYLCVHFLGMIFGKKNKYTPIAIKWFVFVRFFIFHSISFYLLQHLHNQWCFISIF